MTITERLERIQQRAQIARDDGSLREDLAKVQRVEARASTLADSVRRIGVAYSELKPVVTNVIADLAPQIQSIADTLSSLAEQVRHGHQVGGQADFTESLAAVEKSTTAVESALAEAWSAYRNAHTRPTVDRALLEAFETSGLPVGELIDQHDDAVLKISLLEERQLPNQGAVKLFNQTVDKLNSVAKSLSILVPTSIAEFLQLAASPEGAPLSTLNDEVRMFLLEHDIADRFSIRGCE